MLFMSTTLTYFTPVDKKSLQPREMSSLWKLKLKRHKKPYDKQNLKRAYEATQSGMSVYRASRVYSVPESTLRDRTRNNVQIDCSSGPERLFKNEEEKQLVEHIVYMANIGYGYTLGDVQYMAAEFARSLGKTVKAKEGLSQGWLYSFLNRWDQLKVVSPQKLGLPRAKSASKETIDNYFAELETVMKDNNLLNSPERIYNVDESGLSTEHTPPKIVCDKHTTAQAVTSARTKNVTVVGGANALGNHIPPFYIFPGKRWSDSLIEGAAPGSDGEMSESGWINRVLFEKYITEHFAKHAGVHKDGPTTLVLYDGHKSHISLTLTNWAKEQNVVLFVLPPHTSHITQPLDVGVFGPLKKYYYQECKAYMHKNPGVSITRYEVASLTAKPYAKAFSPENVVSAFRKSGIYPFDSGVVKEQQTAPAQIYPQQCESDTVPVVTTEPETVPVVTTEPSSVPVVSTEPRSVPVVTTEHSSVPVVTTEPSSVPQRTNSQTFLDSKKITVVAQRPKKKFVPPVKVTGNLLSEKNVSALETIQEKKVVKETASRKKVGKKVQSPKPSTSGLGKIRVQTLPVPIESDVSSDETGDDNETCCVCKKTTPPELSGLFFTDHFKWGQCDHCAHWVHLAHCTPVRVVRKNTPFRCIHCPEE